MKGSKQCPSCSSAVGPRTKICACGFAFEFKSKLIGQPTVDLPRIIQTKLRNTVQDDVSPDRSMGTITGTVLVPAGACPVPFKGDLQMWVNGIRQHADDHNKVYAPSVYTYWASMQWVDRFSDEGRQMLKDIEELANKQ